MNDTFLPGSGFDTYESQDKVLTVLPPVDAARDDSTALAALPQETLARLLLPLGEFDAGDLAELAQELQL